MNFKELFEGVEPQLPGAPQGIQIMTPQQFVAKAGDMPGEEEGVAEAVTLDRNKNPSYPNDPATVKHRLDSAKAILSDPNSDSDSRRAAAAIIAKSEKGVAEKMLPKSAFAGSDKNKLGPAGQWKNTGPSKNRPARAGDLVGDAEESIERESKIKGTDGKACWKGYRYAGTKNGKDKCVPVSEDVENIMATLINKIIFNEAVQNNK